MSEYFDHGPVDTYEITWMSGHIEQVQAHQVTFPHSGMASFGGIVSTMLRTESDSVPRVRMHAEINGRWVLTLQAREEDIRSIRLVTIPEQVPGPEVAQ